jgi:phage terminase large subunit GpA-like protein
MEREVIKGLFDGIRPEPIMTVTAWADKYRVLGSLNAAPGPYQSSKTPYLIEPMNLLSAHISVEKVIFMKGAQLGGTEVGNNWCGYVISMVPGPMMMVQPTEETVKRNSKTRIDPMIESTPILSERIKPNAKRDKGNTIFSKDFPGGVLIMTGANSAAALRSMPIKYLFLDEIDGYPMDLEGEGSPIELAMARTRTFAKKKSFLVSTPLVRGRSVIEREFLNSDQRYYHVPCPECGAIQKLIFAQLKWEKGKPQTAKYECAHCNELIDEWNKPQMLKGGEWVADKPEQFDGKTAGFHLNSLYSPLGWFSWEDIARTYEDALGDVNKMRTFVNTILGETWVERGDAPEWQAIYDKREEYNMNEPPVEVCFITAGADVQKDRLEVEIVGWAKGKKSYSIDYRVIMGATNEPEVWKELGLIMNETWKRADGLQLSLSLLAVDTGYNTSYVYDFCQKFDASRIVPVKGMDNQAVIISSPKAINVNRAGQKIGAVKAWMVGVSIVKSEIYGWLRLSKKEDGTTPPGYCYFPQYDQEHFKRLTAEQIEAKVVRGFTKYQWVKKYPRNEQLDCRVYARAAAAVLGIDRFEDEHYDSMAGIQKDESDTPRKRSTFWD